MEVGGKEALRVGEAVRLFRNLATSLNPLTHVPLFLLFNASILRQ